MDSFSSEYLNFSSEAFEMFFTLNQIYHPIPSCVVCYYLSCPSALPGALGGVKILLGLREEGRWELPLGVDTRHKDSMWMCPVCFDNPEGSLNQASCGLVA